MAEEPKNPAARVRNQGSDWLRPIRAVSISFDVRKVALAAVGLLMIRAGWFVLIRLLPGPAAADILSAQRADFGRLSIFHDSLGVILAEAVRKLAEPALVLIAPLWEFFTPETELSAAVRALSEVAYTVVILGIVGGAIARSAVSEAARGERLSLVESFRFAFKHAGALIAAPLFPLLAAILCGLVAAPLGLLFHLPGVGIVPFALSLVAILLLTDLLVSWPLMHAAVAAEGEDSLDALTRSFGFVNRRPVQFVSLVALVWLVGSAGLIVIELIASVALRLSLWGTSLTSLDSVLATTDWLEIVEFLVHAWVYAYFWSAAALIYLTLRRDIDGAPWSEVAPGP